MFLILDLLNSRSMPLRCVSLTNWLSVCSNQCHLLTESCILPLFSEEFESFKMKLFSFIHSGLEGVCRRKFFGHKEFIHCINWLNTPNNSTKNTDKIARCKANVRHSVHKLLRNGFFFRTKTIKFIIVYALRTRTFNGIEKKKRKETQELFILNGKVAKSWNPITAHTSAGRSSSGVHYNFRQ